MEENRYNVALLPVTPHIHPPTPHIHPPTPHIHPPTPHMHPPTPHIHPHRQLKMELVEVKAEKERGLNRIERYKVRARG